MKDALNKLREGRVSFATFARETKGDWERMALRLLSRWRAPSTVEVDDLVQEMLLEAWVAVQKYDPAKGALQPFVVWRANTAAKRWLNVERGVSSHNGDKCKSRFAKPCGDMLTHDPSQRDAFPLPSVEASQERIMQYLQRLQAAARMLYTEQNRVLPDPAMLDDMEGVLELLIACGETPWSRVGKFLQQTAIQLEE